MPHGRKEVTAMVELCLKIGNSETNTQEITLLMFSISSVLQWIFFLVVAIIIAKYIKRKNADSDRKKHS